MVLMCDSGQVTNHVIRLCKHIAMAALMNRTLVLPPDTLDYQYAHLLDVAHLQRCLDNATIITFEAFHHPLHIDKLVCFMPGCFFDREHQTKWEARGFTFGQRQDVWSSATMPRRRDVRARFAREGADVLAVGDLFCAEVDDWDV